MHSKIPLFCHTLTPCTGNQTTTTTTERAHKLGGPLGGLLHSILWPLTMPGPHAPGSTSHMFDNPA